MLRRMLSVPTRLALILMALLPLAAAAQETQDPASLPEALRPVRVTLGEAYAKLDGAAAASHFADNAVIEFNGQVLSGKQAVAGWFGEMLASLSSLKPGTPTFIIGEGEVTERSSYTVVTTQGDQQQGRSETLWKRQADGSWKVARLLVL